MKTFQDLCVMEERFDDSDHIWSKSFHQVNESVRPLLVTDEDINWYEKFILSYTP